MHNTKDKGDKGLAFTIAFATEQGWSCCVPLSEHQSYDLIAEKDGVCKRIQARYTTPKNGKLAVKLASSWADKQGNHSITRSKGDYDTLSVYDPLNKRVYFINDEEFENVRAITLRLEPSKNGQKKGIRMAEDFLALK